MTIVDQAFIKSISPDRVECFLEGKNFVRGGMWYFGLEGPWILIGLDIALSVVEHLTSDAGVLG